MLRDGTMINISIPNICVPEISYVVEILFNELLGLSYSISTYENLRFYRIDLENGKTLFIANEFFKTDNLQELYVNDNIPEEVLEDVIIVDDNSFKICPIYGNASLNNEKDKLILSCDIISSSFFMLSRWEEYCQKERDEHDRFLFKHALSIKCDFYHIPVVNQYVDLLYALLRKMGLKQERASHRTQITLSHDIDYLSKWSNFNSFKSAIISNIKSKNINALIRASSSFILNRLGIQKDPYNTLKFLANIAKENGFKSIFYFMVNKTDERFDRFDYRLNSEKLKNLLIELKDIGSEFGIHPSYNTYQSELALKNEIDLINKELTSTISRSRQHYLRIDIPVTTRYLNRLGIKEDSTLLYGPRIGFRNGICHRFKMFDFKERSMLDIYQLPLIFMENHHLIRESEDVEHELSAVMKLVRKYHGNVSLLWHNSNLDTKLKRNRFHSFLSQIVPETKVKS